MIVTPLPPFRPPPLLAGGHRQTLAGYLLRGDRHVEERARRQTIVLEDGDRLVLHDDRPPTWRDGGRVALLSHGLVGCHGSAYMRRIAARLVERGVRVFRLDHRGCGAAAGLAERPTHAGRHDDLRAAVEAIAATSPGAPLTLVGFSLSGNLTLNLMAESGEHPPGGLDSAIAVSPPIDLAACCRRIGRGGSRIYDRYFCKILWRQFHALRETSEPARRLQPGSPPRSLWDFDELVTAPLAGFASADDYYAESSSAPRLAAIRLPTLVVTSADDPVVPAEIFEAAPRGDHVTLHVTAGGGHLGFIAAAGRDPDRRWLDWRIVEWIAALGPTS